MESQAEKSRLWREWYIMSTIIFQHFASGVGLGYAAVLLPAMTSSTSDIHATREEASWIVSSAGISGIVGYIVIPGIQQLYGRKVCNIFVNAAVLISSMIVAFAANVTTVLIGILIQGFTQCGMHLAGYTVAEFTHPKRRGFFITLKANVFYLGILICHCTVPVLTWRQTNWLIAVPSVLGVLATLTWPESPSWLAYQGRYDECRKSFTWVRGEGSEAEMEIKELIIAQKELRKQNSDYNQLKGIATAFGKKDFLRPISVLLLVTVLAQASGLHFMLAFIIEIMTKLTEDSSKAYYLALAFDSIKILAGLLSSLLVRFLNRRALIMFSGTSLIFLMGMICMCSYLVSRSVISATWLVPSLLIAFNAMCYIGLMPLAFVLTAEILPVQYRGVGASVNGVLFCTLSFVVIKITPIMLDKFDVHGAFSVYLIIIICSFVCLLCIIPETKDKTLQNIELNFMNVKIKLDEENLVDMPLNVKDDENKL